MNRFATVPELPESPDITAVTPSLHPYLDRLLVEAHESGASDLHLIVGVPPAFRITGEIILANADALAGPDCHAMTESLLNPVQRRKLEQEWELCISIHHPTAGRIRVTCYKRNGVTELSCRFCGERIPTREELALPARVDDFARRPNGLILVTGPTGAGKTTTLNYMIDLINRERRCKILTIEDPIEFVHHNQRAIVVQQEVLTDVRSFNRALIHALRQDPDVICVGEMRDHEAIATALTAAETGHLVLATLHAPSVGHALERMIGVFEGNAQKQVILQLSNSLQGIIAQELLPSLDRSRRILAYEVLVASNAVRAIIRDNQLHQLTNIMQTSARDGQVLMDNCLHDLYARCLISYDTAVSRARNLERFQRDGDGSR
ncbi:MAG TPA: PilT/PilU family type 4a pilus ATPase [Verrucomicrobiota bacterium]|nr:PilT/PilU family type 4a pilus ATPase [Verrucomicrobiota bacterium]